MKFGIFFVFSQGEGRKSSVDGLRHYSDVVLVYASV